MNKTHIEAVHPSLGKRTFTKFAWGLLPKGKNGWKQLRGQAPAPPEAGGDVAAEDAAPRDLSSMVKSDLQHILAQGGVQYNAKATNAELIELINQSDL